MRAHLRKLSHFVRESPQVLARKGLLSFCLKAKNFGTNVAESRVAEWKVFQIWEQER